MLAENTIHLGDCLDLMRSLPDKSIDLVLTDPPYVLKNGGSGESCLKSIGKIATGLKAIEDGFDVDSVFLELKRVCRLFNLFCFCSNKQVSEIMAWGESHGYFTTLLVWYKVNTTPFANGVWRSDLEFIVHIREKGATFQGGCDVKSKLTQSPYEISKHGHPTEKPLAIIEKFLKIGSNPNDLILDPFSGSGTTAIAAHNLGRRFICIEKDEDYHAASVQRLKDTQAQLRLF